MILIFLQVSFFSRDPHHFLLSFHSWESQLTAESSLLYSELKILYGYYCSRVTRRLLPLVYKNKLPVYRMPRNVFQRFHPDLPVHRLWNHVRVQSSYCDEAAEVTPLVVWFIVFIQPHLCGWPAFQIACAVDCAEAFAIC